MLLHYQHFNKFHKFCFCNLLNTLTNIFKKYSYAQYLTLEKLYSQTIGK